MSKRIKPNLKDWDLSELYADEKRRHDFRTGFRYGVICAAELAGNFDAQTNLRHRLEDIIICKFNMTTRKRPRLKKSGS